MASKRQLRILKTSELTHLYALSVEGGQYCAAAGGAEIYGKIGGHGKVNVEELKNAIDNLLSVECQCFLFVYQSSIIN